MRCLHARTHLLNENVTRKQPPAPDASQKSGLAPATCLFPLAPAVQNVLGLSLKPRLLMARRQASPFPCQRPAEHTCPDVLLELGPWKNINQIREK